MRESVHVSFLLVGIAWFAPNTRSVTGQGLARGFVHHTKLHVGGVGQQVLQIDGQAIVGSHPLQINQGQSAGYADHGLGPRCGLSGKTSRQIVWSNPHANKNTLLISKL
jgi:hypothetical protein